MKEGKRRQSMTSVVPFLSLNQLTCVIVCFAVSSVFLSPSFQLLKLRPISLFFCLPSSFSFPTLTKLFPSFTFSLSLPAFLPFCLSLSAQGLGMLLSVSHFARSAEGRCGSRSRAQLPGRRLGNAGELLQGLPLIPPVHQHQQANRQQGGTRLRVDGNG